MDQYIHPEIIFDERTVSSQNLNTLQSKNKKKKKKVILPAKESQWLICCHVDTYEIRKKSTSTYSMFQLKQKYVLLGNEQKIKIINGKSRANENTQRLSFFQCLVRKALPQCLLRNYFPKYDCASIQMCFTVAFSGFTSYYNPQQKVQNPYSWKMFNCVKKKRKKIRHASKLFSFSTPTFWLWETHKKKKLQTNRNSLQNKQREENMEITKFWRKIFWNHASG